METTTLLDELNHVCIEDDDDITSDALEAIAELARAHAFADQMLQDLRDWEF